MLFFLNIPELLYIFQNKLSIVEHFSLKNNRLCYFYTQMPTPVEMN